MAVDSSRSDWVWSTGAAATGSVWTTVRPALPSAWLMAWAMACTAGGCVSPAMTRLDPLCARRSLRHRGDPPGHELRGPAREHCGRRGARETDRGRDQAGKRLDLARPQRQAMIGARAGWRRHALDGVQPVHPLGLFRTPSCRELARVTKRARSAGEEVGVEGQNHVGPVDAVVRVDDVAERQSGAKVRVVPAGGVPLMPPGLGIPGQHGLHLRRQGWASRSTRSEF